MKGSAAVVLAGALGTTAMVADPRVLMFKTWQRAHGKSYGSTEFEAVKLETFKSNVAFIEEHNAKSDEHGFTVAINQFADLSQEEYRDMLLGSGPKPEDLNHVNPVFERRADGLANPDHIDWRQAKKQGLLPAYHNLTTIVTPVKDQGQCGSCWAFSTVASLEGQYAKTYDSLVSLSEQQLVDCNGFTDHGCNGGLMDNAFNYIHNHAYGLATEASYEYHAKKQRCHATDGSALFPTPAARVSKHTDVKKHNEGALEDASATIGTIAVAIDASRQSFQFYSSGIYSEPQCSSSQLDHGVSLVGYTNSPSGNFYIVKNSWGTGWGLDGYIHMAKDANNMCGIATTASFPTVPPA